MYAVVLFTSAFILLLFTYYSQNQFDKNINDYINKLSEEEKKKISVQSNLYTVSEENKALKKQIEDLNKAVSSLKKDIKTNESETKVLDEKYSSTVKAYEKLINAEDEYLKGKIIESASILLNNCEKKYLNVNAAQKYDYLVNKTYFKASQQLYTQGFTAYKNKMYNDAILKLEQSLSFDRNNYFSDDCYYFISHSYIKMGNKELAKKNLEELLVNYPDSSYKKDSLNLIKKLE